MKFSSGSRPAVSSNLGANITGRCHCGGGGGGACVGRGGDKDKIWSETQSFKRIYTGKLEFALISKNALHPFLKLLLLYLFLPSKNKTVKSVHWWGDRLNF